MLQNIMADSESQNFYLLVIYNNVFRRKKLVGISLQFYMNFKIYLCMYCVSLMYSCSSEWMTEQRQIF